MQEFPHPWRKNNRERKESPLPPSGLPLLAWQVSINRLYKGWTHPQMYTQGYSCPKRPWLPPQDLRPCLPKILQLQLKVKKWTFKKLVYKFATEKLQESDKVKWKCPVKVCWHSSQPSTACCHLSFMFFLRHLVLVLDGGWHVRIWIIETGRARGELVTLVLYLVRQQETHRETV